MLRGALAAGGLREPAVVDAVVGCAAISYREGGGSFHEDMKGSFEEGGGSFHEDVEGSERAREGAASGRASGMLAREDASSGEPSCRRRLWRLAVGRALELRC